MGSIFFSSLEIRQDKDYFCGIFADPTVIVLLFGDYDGANQIDVRRSEFVSGRIQRALRRFARALFSV